MVPLREMTYLGIKTEADIFAICPVQNTVYESNVSPYRPVSIISESGPIEICIPPSQDYVDLSNILLHITCQIVKPDGTLFKQIAGVSQNIAPVNLPAHSIFENIIVSLNKKVISNNPNYPFRAIIESVINYSSEAKATHLANQLYYKDTARFMDARNDTNTGFINRKKLTENSAEFEMVCPLHLDILNQPKYLLNGVEMSFKFYPHSKPSFYMMGDDECKIKIVDINLITRKVKLNPATIESHAKVLQLGPAKYPINRIEIKTYTLNEKLMSKLIDNIYLGPLPNRVLVGMVSTKAYNGSMDTNPYNFQNFNLSEISILFDNQNIPGHPIRMDFSKGKFATAYLTLFSGTGRFFSDSGNYVTPHDFANGYGLFCFDLTPDLSSSAQYWSVQRTGNMSINLRFGKELPHNITVIVYSEFDNLIEIDKFRNVIVDYPC
jgi:hypothetical protein